MTPHTPGPWNQCAAMTCDPRSIRYVGGPEGESIADVRQPVSMLQDVALANARLICAAPDLLELAKDLVNWTLSNSDAIGTPRALFERAETIIAQAEGRL